MFQLFLNNIHEYCDAPRPWGIYFQDSATPQMEALVELHDNIMYYLITILFGVVWILTSIVRNYASTKSPISHKYLNHGIYNVPIYNNSNSISPLLVFFVVGGYALHHKKKLGGTHEESVVGEIKSVFRLLFKNNN
jgi:heme/copper-type cytochrome/quinol oxidase subunit 2